jgi:hypothetical protein
MPDDISTPNNNNLPAPIKPYSLKHILRQTAELRRWLTLIFLDLADTLTSIFGNSALFNLFGNYGFNPGNALIWFIQFFEDIARLKATITSKLKRAILTVTSLLGFATAFWGALFSIYSYSFPTGFAYLTAALIGSFCIAIAAAIFSVRAIIYFALSLRKSCQAGLLSDRNSSIKKLLADDSSLKTDDAETPDNAKIRDKLQEIRAKPQPTTAVAKKDDLKKIEKLYKLLRLSLQSEAITFCRTDEKNPEPMKDSWQQLLTHDLLSYERDKLFERGIETALTSTAAVASFFLLAPPFAPIGIFMLASVAAISITLAIIKVCRTSFEHWKFKYYCALYTGTRAINHSYGCKESWDKDPIAQNYLQPFKLSDEGKSNYWEGLPPEARYEKRAHSLYELVDQQQNNPQNRGKLIALWVHHQIAPLILTRSMWLPADVNFFSLKGLKTVGCGILNATKALFFTVLLAAPALLVAGYYGIADNNRKKKPEDQQALLSNGEGEGEGEGKGETHSLTHSPTHTLALFNNSPYAP